MPKWSHIDTEGLPDTFDCADLIEKGLSRDEIKQWIADRLRDGPAPLPVKAVETPPKPRFRKENHSQGQCAYR